MYMPVTLLVAAFAFCEAANVAKRDEQCTGMLQCANIVSQMEPSSLGPMQEEERYEHLCQISNDLRTCFHNIEEDCQDLFLLNTVLVGVQTLGFLCSAQGKEEIDLDSVKDSPCLNDQTTALSAKEGISECVQSFQNELQLASFSVMSTVEELESINVCFYLDQLKSCILGSVENDCGQNISTVARKLVDIGYQPFAMELRCGQQDRHIRSLKSRLVPLSISGVRRRS
ncbi:uncharacterized protein LOC106053021 isoform X1 [Biomphalaria glabrata]|uniref:Uncharacterized protein LOC106053021 isoform X1 n=1 Tax=Biomphalaria glabrata TaxID=6526 RepID=A0A9U8DW20_BIOGL|nr:uncharacterized protein LOC106053021 isoform X1 [Biomphalaria glabrata]KAI8750518.1 hypothetical protein BgiBS90_032123 [Biomphalaria glabrata]